MNQIKKEKKTEETSRVIDINSWILEFRYNFLFAFLIPISSEHPHTCLYHEYAVWDWNMKLWKHYLVLIIRMFDRVYSYFFSSFWHDTLQTFGCRHQIFNVNAKIYMRNQSQALHFTCFLEHVDVEIKKKKSQISKSEML